MTPDIHAMPEETRRSRQRAAGLRYETSVPLQEDTVNAQTAAEHDNTAPSIDAKMARAAMQRLAKDQTFGDIAVYELKRVAVWVPVAVSAALGVMWANKRWFTR